MALLIRGFQPTHSFHFFLLVKENQDLLALMTILAQSLLALVSCHLVALLFLSVWHNTNNL